MFYLDTDFAVREYCYSEGRGWYPGGIGKLGAKANHHGGLAAIAYGTGVLGAGEDGAHIRVYYQSECRLPPDPANLLKFLTDVENNNVEELANDGY